MLQSTYPAPQTPAASRRRIMTRSPWPRLALWWSVLSSETIVGSTRASAGWIHGLMSVLDTAMTSLRSTPTITNWRVFPGFCRVLYATCVRSRRGTICSSTRLAFPGRHFFLSCHSTPPGMGAGTCRRGISRHHSVRPRCRWRRLQHDFVRAALCPCLFRTNRCRSVGTGAAAAFVRHFFRFAASHKLSLS